MWVEGTLRLEYGKSGIYNNNRLSAEEEEKEKEKKEENTRDRSVPDGSDNKAKIRISLLINKGNDGTLYCNYLNHLCFFSFLIVHVIK